MSDPVVRWREDAGGFSAIPNSVLRRSDLSAVSRVLYGCLISHAWQDESCFPGQARLGEYVGRSDRQVRRYLDELTNAGLIEVQRQGAMKSNLYVLLPVSDVTPPSDHDGTSASSHKRTPTSGEEDTERTLTGSQKKTQEVRGTFTRLPKVAGKQVTVAEWHRAGEILGAFNGAAQTSYTLHAHFTPIIGRIREHPELTADQHSQIIARAFASPWWGDHPGPEVIYGKASLFERAIEGWRRRGTAPEKRQRVVA